MTSAMATEPSMGPETANDLQNDIDYGYSRHVGNTNIAEPYKAGYTHGYTQGYIAGVASKFMSLLFSWGPLESLISTPGNTTYQKADFSPYSEPEGPKQRPIAIVGMSCRLPGNVSTPDEFWELCSRSRTGWTEVPKERFQSASFYHPNQGKRGCFNASGGNFLKEDVGLFDAPFFSLTAQEAISMDPLQRMLLECTFEALDSAGIPKHTIVGENVGVFIGGSFSEYESQLFTDTETIPMHQATGKEKFASTEYMVTVINVLRLCVLYAIE